MITCRKSAELISRELDTELPFHLRFCVAFHNLACRSCRRFRQQMGIMEQAVQQLFASGPPTAPAATTMPPMSKQRLKSAIAEQLENES